MEYRGFRRALIIILLLAGIVPVAVFAQLFGIGISQVYVSAMPTWMYNGFTEDADGDPVQGSDVSPLRMTFGAGFELRFFDTVSVEPEIWFFMQEYIALKDYDKTVPTQIETGSAVGEIANTIGVGISIPLVYTWEPGWAPNWQFDGRAGLGLVYRIPIAGIDDTDPGDVGVYWIAGRFLYPQIGVAADYQFTQRIQVGIGLDWLIPIYNAWDGGEETPFLDETMLRWGARIRWDVGSQDR